MGKPNGFKKMNRFVIASSVISGVIVGACSPVAPSVSKLSNAATEKTNPTDGSAPSNNTSTASTLNQKNITAEGDSSQQTELYTLSGFQKHWEKVSVAKPAVEVDGKTLDTFMRKNGASFEIANKKIKGREAELAKGKIRIYVIVENSIDKSKAKNLGLNEVRLGLSWNDKTNQWVLAFVEPNQSTGDPVKDSDAEQVRQAFLKNLAGIAVEFEAEF